jgi:hypothetical protein
MSLIASGSQIIFADTDGVFEASLATCTVVVGPVFAVVGLDVLTWFPELPHAARSDAQATDAMATVRSCTQASYRPASENGGRENRVRKCGDSVRRVRRPVVLALASGFATALLIAVSGTPASAHICPVPAQIPVGTTATVNIGVTVEQATVPDVEIDVPSGLHLDQVYEKAGWSVTRRGSVLRYRGGPIEPFTCAYFPLGVTASARGTFGVPVVQRDAAGRVVARTTPDPNSSQDRALDQFVYAGVKPPSTGGSSQGPSVVVIGGIALVAIGVLAGGVLAWRSRRSAGEDEDDDTGGESATGDRDAELRERLERFRTRGPDRTSSS